MKTWSILVAVLVLGFCANLVLAQEGHAKQNAVRGKVTKVDSATLTVQPGKMGADGKLPDAKTVLTDDKTVVTVGSLTGDKKTVADIKVDDKIMAVLGDDGKTAKTIVINPTPPTPKKESAK